MTPPTCDQMRELAPDLALGLLTGAERAAALDHLEGCAACRAEVASLTDVGEAVLALAPEVEPPPGFTARVLDRIAAARADEARGDEARGDEGPVAEPPAAAVPGARALEASGPGATPGPDHRLAGEAPAPGDTPTPAAGPSRRSRRRWAVPAAVAAAAAVLAVVGAVGLAVTSDDGDGDGRGGAELAAELRTAAGRVVGRATVDGADPTTLTVEMDGWLDRPGAYGEDGARTWWLRVATRDGGEESYALPRDRADPWHVPLDDGGGQVASVAVVDETGRTWCSGSFDPPAADD
ncbi:MAG TPA: zf-HC2 domain-containing protein [Acidimicrobiales bacterium]